MKKVLLIGEPLIRITPTNYQELTDGVESRVFLEVQKSMSLVIFKDLDVKPSF